MVNINRDSDNSGSEWGVVKITKALLHPLITNHKSADFRVEVRIVGIRQGLLQLESRYLTRAIGVHCLKPCHNLGIHRGITGVLWVASILPVATRCTRSTCRKTSSLPITSLEIKSNRKSPSDSPHWSGWGTNWRVTLTQLGLEMNSSVYSLLSSQDSVGLGGSQI